MGGKNVRLVGEAAARSDDIIFSYNRLMPSMSFAIAKQFSTGLEGVHFLTGDQSISIVVFVPTLKAGCGIIQCPHVRDFVFFDICLPMSFSKMVWERLT
jgi:hypothetical protein